MIYIDLGCYNGDTVEQFINWGQLFGDISEAEIYAFDPQKFPKSWKDIKLRQSQHVKKMEFRTKAAWTDNTTLTLSDKGIGATVMFDKARTHKAKTVKAFNFPAWLDRLKDKEIYLKMDIEGAEYPILEKMINFNLDKKIKLLMVEWHAGKMGDDWRRREADIKENLRCKWIEWR